MNQNQMHFEFNDEEKENKPMRRNTIVGKSDKS